jgi:hypothetical protein
MRIPAYRNQNIENVEMLNNSAAGNVIHPIVQTDLEESQNQEIIEMHSEHHIEINQERNYPLMNFSTITFKEDYLLDDGLNEPISENNNQRYINNCSLGALENNEKNMGGLMRENHLNFNQ